LERATPPGFGGVALDFTPSALTFGSLPTVSSLRLNPNSRPEFVMILVPSQPINLVKIYGSL
jgi:hypothetical protein